MRAAAATMTASVAGPLVVLRVAHRRPIAGGRFLHGVLELGAGGDGVVDERRLVPGHDVQRPHGVGRLAHRRDRRRLLEVTVAASLLGERSRGR